MLKILVFISGYKQNTNIFKSLLAPSLYTAFTTEQKKEYLQ